MSMHKGLPAVEGDGKLDFYRKGRDLFLTLNGETIAKRGRPGTKHAGTWIMLKPDIQSIEMEGIDCPHPGEALH